MVTPVPGPELFILGIAHSDCFCQKSKYVCEVFLLEYLFFFNIHED